MEGAIEELGAVGVKLATNPEPVTMDMLIMVAEDSHIVFGSNYPHSPANVIIAKKKHFDENDKYARIRELIYGSNYKQLLKP